MIRLLALFSILACLLGCGAHSVKPPPPEAPPNVKALTAPTRIEGAYASTGALADDPNSKVEDLTNFAVQAESAVFRCNIDKASLLEYLVPTPETKCHWYNFGKCKDTTK